MLAGKKDIENAADVRAMVDGSYLKVQSDPLLAPIFLNAGVDWE
jgi:hypothetical protein